MFDLGTNVRLRNGALRQLTGICKPDTVFCSLDRAAADGSRVLVPSGDGRTTVVDLASRRRIQLLGQAFLAGRFAAWRTTDTARQIIVYDTAAQREVLRLPTGDPAALERIDLAGLQSDGAVLLKVPAPSNAVRLAWASPREPSIHLLPVAPGGFGATVIARDTVVYARLGVTSGDERIAAVGLRGSSRTLVRSARAVFAFDGTRLAWAKRTCSGLRLRVAGLDGLRRRPESRASKCS